MVLMAEVVALSKAFSNQEDLGASSPGTTLRNTTKVSHRHLTRRGAAGM